MESAIIAKIGPNQTNELVSKYYQTNVKCKILKKLKIEKETLFGLAYFLNARS